MHFSSFRNGILITEFVSVNHADHVLLIVHSLLYHVKVTHVDIMWIKIHAYYNQNNSYWIKIFKIYYI